MRKIVILTYLFFTSVNLFAEDFIVTSNASEGPNTLREAISKANGNGTATKDHIFFNLPGNSLNDVTIKLTSALPNLSSNLVIDATAQISPLKSSSIKVRLEKNSANYFSGLVLNGVSDIEIYGLYFSNFNAQPGIATDLKTAAIHLIAVRNIKIGDVNKQNGFGNNYTSIFSPTTATNAYVLENVKISANIIGLDEALSVRIPNEYAMDLSYLSNSIIGGNTVEEGNIFSSNENGVSLAAIKGQTVFQHNKLEFDLLNVKKPTAEHRGFMADGEHADFDFTANQIVGFYTGVYFYNFKNRLKITHNKINNNLKHGIYLDICTTGEIGEGNTIEGNDEGIFIEKSSRINVLKSIIKGNNIGVRNKSAHYINIKSNFIENNNVAISNWEVNTNDNYPITISQNSASCNVKFLEFIKGIPTPIAFDETRVVIPKIQFLSPNQLTGIYLPNSIIELFYTDACEDCQGKIYIGSALTDANGHWTFNHNFTGPITSTGTNSDGATSSFSKPLIDESLKQIVHTTCGKTEGSIRGLIAYDSSVFTWVNATGQVVGTALDLENVGPGIYKLRYGQNGLCDKEAGTFEILGANNSIIENIEPIIKSASCNKPSGSIVGVKTTNDLPRKWYNSNHELVAEGNDLLMVLPGEYYFTTGDGACLFTSDKYQILNNELKFTTQVDVIVAANCDLENGRILLKPFVGEIPTNFVWKNAIGEIVNQGKDLTNQSAGDYQLYLGNEFCEIFAGKFTIPLAQKPAINLANYKAFLSCDSKTVYTMGITTSFQNENFIYEWFSESGQLVYKKLNLNQAAPGKYKLKVTDPFNCTVETDWLDFSTLENTGISIPNTFSPNLDGINDVWQIKGIENYPHAEVKIINRNGSVIYNSIGYNVPFNGQFNGKYLPVGVYYYIIDLKGSCKPITGSLTLLK